MVLQKYYVGHNEGSNKYEQSEFQHVRRPLEANQDRGEDDTSVYHSSAKWCVYISDVAGDIAPYLLTLANRNNPICVAPPKVAKASTKSVAVACVIA